MQVLENKDTYYDNWLVELDSCELFAAYQRGHEGRHARGNGRLQVPAGWTAELMVRIGNMMMRHPTLMELGHTILRTAHDDCSIAEWHAKNFKIAREVLLGKTRVYTRNEKLIVLEVLRSLDGARVHTIGWCAERYMQTQTGLRAKIKQLTGK